LGSIFEEAKKNNHVTTKKQTGTTQYTENQQTRKQHTQNKKKNIKNYQHIK
jgi:hypothetical protein